MIRALAKMRAPSRRQILVGGAATALAVAAGAGSLPGGRPANEHPVIVAVGRKAVHGVSDLFYEGVALAVEKVNAAGGLLGQQVELRFIEETPPGDFARLSTLVVDTLTVSSEIASDPHVVAVIGHPSSSTAIAASAVYDQANKLFLATYASSLLLTATKFSRVFSLLPNDRDATQVIARHAKLHGLNRFVIFSDSTSYGQECAGFFAQALTQEGGVILHTRVLDIKVRSVDSILLYLLDNPLFTMASVEGIFLAAGGGETNAAFITRARQLGIKTPIFGTDAVTSSSVSGQVGPAMRDVFGVSAFDVMGNSPENQAFDAAFHSRFDTAPSPTAALGHDAVLLVAHAAALADTLDARKMADAMRVMRYGRPLRAATGTIAFNADGQATDNDLFILHHDGSAFHTIAGYRQPLLEPVPRPSGLLSDTPLSPAPPIGGQSTETAP